MLMNYSESTGGSSDRAWIFRGEAVVTAGTYEAWGW